MSYKVCKNPHLKYTLIDKSICFCGEMDITTAFEAVIEGSTPSGSTKLSAQSNY